MRTLLFLSVQLVSIACLAQVPPRQPPSRPIAGAVVVGQPESELGANYALTLAVTAPGKTNLNLSLVVAKSNFQINVPKWRLSFSGSLREQEGGKLMLEYSLTAVEPTALPDRSDQHGGPVFQQPFQQSGWSSSVLLSLDKPVAVLTRDNEVYKLSVSRLRE